MELDCSIADQINRLNSQINAWDSRLDLTLNYFNACNALGGNNCINTFQWNTNALVPVIYKPPNYPNKEIWKETDEFWIVVDHQVGPLKLLSIVWKKELF